MAYVLSLLLYLSFFVTGNPGAGKISVFTGRYSTGRYGNTGLHLAMDHVFFHDGFLCGGRVFSMDGDCLRVVQSILTVGHTWDRSGRPLPVCCHHRGKHLESLSRTSNSRNSSKNLHPTHREPLRNGNSGYELTRTQVSDVTR